MSDTSQGDGWWIASDGKWYAPESHPDYVAPEPSAPAPPVIPPATSSESASDTIIPPTLGSPGSGTPSALPPTLGAPGAGSPSSLPPTLGAPGSGPASSLPPTLGAPGAGVPSSPAAPIYGSSDPSATQVISQSSGAPNYALSAEPVKPESGSSRKGLFIGIAAVILVAALAFLLFRLFTGGDGGTGAASPEDVVTQMVAAVNDNEAVGLVELFDPDEVEGWIGSFEPFASRFSELQPEDESAEALTESYQAFFEAFDIALTGLDGGEVQLSTEQLDDAGQIMLVRIEGLRIEVNTPDPESNSIVVGVPGEVQGLPLGEIDGLSVEIRSSRGGIEATAQLPSGTTETEFLDGAQLSFVTVQKDGQWYINVGYSVLELAREATGAFDRPDYGRAYALVESQEGGAESPDAAFREFFMAFEDLDYNEMIRLTDPLSLPYLHDYAPAIDDQVDPRDQREAAQEFDLRFETFVLGESEWEGRTVVTIEEIAGRVAGGTFRLDARDWCIEAVSPEGDREEGCLEEAIGFALEELNNFEDDPRDFVPEEFGLVVIERNGRWYLDPLGSLGYAYDQIGEAAFDLFEDELLSAGSGLPTGGFIVVPAPVVGQGEPVTIEAAPPTIGVAFDLGGFDEIAGDFGSQRVAIARITGDEPGTFFGDETRFDGDDWVTVHSSGDQGSFLPAVAITTEGSVTVGLESAEVIRVGPDGYQGEIDGEGRPQILVFDDSVFDATITGGADYRAVFGFEDAGTVAGPDPFGFGSPTSGLFTVVFGEPGTSFAAEVPVIEPPPLDTPVPVPTPFPEPNPTPSPTATTDGVVFEFENYVGQLGFEFSFDTPGGYFDGCGPTSGPDITTYAYESPDGRLALITPYPSANEAEDAYFQLFDIVSPCDGFAGLNVIDLVEVAEGQIMITYDYDDDPTPQIEHYILVGDAIVIAYGEDAVAVDDLVTFLEGF